MIREERTAKWICSLLCTFFSSPQSAQRSQVYKSSATKCFGDEDCTGLPYAPSCVQNVCTLVCEPHQLETADGNCTLSIETRVDYYGHRSLLPWFNVTVAYVDGVTLDPRCAPSDGCGFILSMEKPSRRYNNFWPEQYNYWPRHQVKT